MKDCSLALENGMVFRGKSFGYEKAVCGEVVFNTAMTGYPESLTDPSYAGQLMVLTYPLVGNYGVPALIPEENGIPKFMESDRIHARAVIVSDYSDRYSHWNAAMSLGEWLRREQVAGICGVDTRSLTKLLRECGVMKGHIIFDGVGNSDVEEDEYGTINFVDRVSCKEVIRYNGGTGRKSVVLVDCGVKSNIIRCLLQRDVEIIRVPWNYDFSTLKYDGLFISNGPGDPDTCEAAVVNIRKAMQDKRLPIFGICLGNQLLAKASGAKTYKLKYGHRSHNQPVRMVGTERCFITSQNHGYAVDENTLGEDWQQLFVNMNDNSNEGIHHKENPWFSAQFHPEAAGGPTDTEFLFDEFVKLL